MLAIRDALACEIDAFGRHVSKFEIRDSGDGNALGDEIALVDPAAHNPLRVAEQADGKSWPASRKRVSMRRLAMW